MSESLQCGATNKKQCFYTVTLIKKKQLEELKTKQINKQNKKLQLSYRCTQQETFECLFFVQVYFQRCSSAEASLQKSCSAVLGDTDDTI